MASTPIYRGNTSKMQRHQHLCMLIPPPSGHDRLELYFCTYSNPNFPNYSSTRWNPSFHWLGGFIELKGETTREDPKNFLNFFPRVDTPSVLLSSDLLTEYRRSMMDTFFCSKYASPGEFVHDSWASPSSLPRQIYSRSPTTAPRSCPIQPSHPGG